MDTDLHQIISSPQPLTDDDCQYFLYQILRALKYIAPRRAAHERRPGDLQAVEPAAQRQLRPQGVRLRAGARGAPGGEPPRLPGRRPSRRGGARAPRTKMLSWRSIPRRSTCGASRIFGELLGRTASFASKDYIHQLHRWARRDRASARRRTSSTSSPSRRRHPLAAVQAEDPAREDLPNANRRRRSSCSTRCSTSRGRACRSPFDGAASEGTRTSPRSTDTADEPLAHAALPGRVREPAARQADDEDRDGRRFRETERAPPAAVHPSPVLCVCSIEQQRDTERTQLTYYKSAAGPHGRDGAVEQPTLHARDEAAPDAPSSLIARRGGASPRLPWACGGPSRLPPFSRKFFSE